MHLIPIMLPLEEDELLGSWLYRLSKANLFDKPDVFLKTFVRPNSHKGYQYINFVGDEEFPAVYQAMQLNTSMADLYLKTTCYGGLAPFITRGQQTRHTNLSFQNTYAHSAFVPKANPLIDELRYCEHCRCEEMRNMGFWYYHRAHQLPGVRVCHKHGCLLKIFDGKIGHEFDEEAPSRSVTPNAEPSIMQQYSVFAKDILVSSPDTDITGTKYAIMSTLQERGYTNCGEGFNKLWSEIERRGMAEMFPVDISQYIRLQLASCSYVPVEQTLAMAFFLYGTAQEFISQIPIAEHRKCQSRLNDGEYQIIGTFRNSLLQLQHKCGTEFCITADGFASGYSCPKCDATKPNQAIFERMIALAGDAKYIPQSRFRSFDAQHQLMHCECGRTLNIKLRSFLLEGARCICNHQSKKEELYGILKQNKDFDLIEYDSKKYHAFIRHAKCNKTFECNCDYFVEDARCPHCESGVQLGIKKALDIDHIRQRISDVVGAEYTLESTAVYKNPPVVIRHNICGHSQKYHIGKFLMGRRCSHCHVQMSVANKKELIGYLSNGEYKTISIEPNGIACIQNTQSGQVINMQWEYIVQELTRPTPSPILPCRFPNRLIESFVPSQSGYYEKILLHLKKTYNQDDVLFKEDFETFGADDLQMKRVTSKLVQKNVVNRVFPGIYKWVNSNISDIDIVYQRYIQRRHEHIGYLCGHSFAYEIGLINKQPDRIYITTNKESGLHGRKHEFLSFTLYLRGSKAEITNENWRILQLLDLLPNLSKYTSQSDADTIETLRNHAHKRQLNYNQAKPYLNLYPRWVEAKAKAILAEE